MVAAPPLATDPSRALVVRLRNWVGDVVLSLPMLRRVQACGYRLHLVGKPWARDLLAGEGWAVEPLAGRFRDRVAQYRRLRQSARAAEPGFDKRLNALALPYSFSCALEMRLAGLRALGHRHEGRGWLLDRSLHKPAQRHELEVYWQLGDALLDAQAPPPASIGLRASAAQAEAAQQLLRHRGLAPGFLMICPFAGGTFAGQDKTWPQFADFAANELRALGRPVVVCPGPGEAAMAQREFVHTVVLEGVNLGVYAALLQQAALMVSNDTGPGHLAAAVGTPLISVLGPSDPGQWRAWGPKVSIVQGAGGWPAKVQVMRALQEQLGAP
jgi:heptosyltransferase II